MTSRLLSKGQSLRQMSSAQAALKVAQSGGSGAALGVGDPKVSTLDNGLTLVSAETSSPLTTLGVVVRVGPRHESYDSRGACHALRNSFGLASKKFSSFAIFKNIQHAGSWPTCSVGKEHMFYSISVPRDTAETVLDFFIDGVFGQAFKPWEVQDNNVRLKVDLEYVSDDQRAMDLLFQAAYRTGLGNATYCTEYNVSKMKPALLHSFFTKNFTSHRTALIGIGVPQDKMALYTDLISLESGHVSGEKSKFYGDQLRLDTGGKRALVYLATEVAGAENKKEQVASMLLHRLLGSCNSIKYSKGGSQMAKAVASDLDAEVSGFFFPFSDSGLLGMKINASGHDAGKVVGQVAATMRNLTVSNEEFNAAKKRLIMDMNEARWNPKTMAEIFGLQAVINQDVATQSVISELVEGASKGDVQALAKKLSSGKWCMSAVGNLGHVPYLESL